jgi:hypothetical protein
MARKDRYKDSPTLARDEESGKMTPTEKKSERVNDDTDGLVKEEGVSATARHAVERMNLHHAHQMEHHTHDSGKHGDKAEMHKRHVEEHKALHKKHEKELGGGTAEASKSESKESKGSGDGEKKIEKVEKEKE